MELGMRKWASKLRLGSFVSQYVRETVVGKSYENAFRAAVADRHYNGAFDREIRRPSAACCYSSESDAPKKRKATPLQERKLIDKFRLHVRGGEGGAGCCSVRKSRQSRYASVDGGNGGRGGDVVLVSSAAVWDLSNLQHHLSGTRGKAGSSKKKVGSRGMDKIVQVPIGTVIHLVKGSIPSLVHGSQTPYEVVWEEWDDGQGNVTSNNVAGGSQDGITEQSTRDQESSLTPDKLREPDRLEESIESIRNIERPCLRSGSETDDSEQSSDEYDSDLDFEEEKDANEDAKQYPKNSVAEFITAGQSIIVASGGEGGKGNASMARGFGAEKGLPSMEYEQGSPGSEAVLILELKSIADVGLVGAPNAGKSTLLGSLSKAKPAIGNYKFTTLRPNIGMLEFDDFFSFTVADIPGLIEGAHENRGLGHAFLRHIERTKLLAYVVDLAGGIGDDTGPRPWDQFAQLVSELELYQKGLSQRPSIIVATKIDEAGATEALEEFRRKAHYLDIYPVCAVLDEGIEELKVGMRKLVESGESLIGEARASNSC